MRWRTRARRSGWRREHRDCRAQREGDVHRCRARDGRGRTRRQRRRRASRAAGRVRGQPRSWRLPRRPRRQRRRWRSWRSRSRRRFSGCTLQGHRAVARSGHDVRRRRPWRRRLRGRETGDARGYEVASAGRTARRAGRWGSGLQAASPHLAGVPLGTSGPYGTASSAVLVSLTSPRPRCHRNTSRSQALGRRTRSSRLKPTCTLGQWRRSPPRSAHRPAGRRSRLGCTPTCPAPHNGSPPGSRHRRNGDRRCRGSSRPQRAVCWGT